LRRSSAAWSRTSSLLTSPLAGLPQGAAEQRTEPISVPTSIYNNPLTRWWAQMTREPEVETALPSPWRLGWRDWMRVLARAADGAMRNDYGIIASSIAFAAFLSILPLLGLVALAYGMLVPREVVTGNIGTLVGILPQSAQRLVEVWLTDSLARQSASGAALLLSAAITLFGARRAGRSLLYGINLASGVEQARSAIASQLVGIAVVLAGAGLLLTALVSISALALIQAFAVQEVPAAVQLFNLLFWASLTLGPATALMLTYRYTPAREPVPWRWLVPGTAVAMVSWLGATLGFRLYVSQIASYGATYGSLSAVVVLQLWLMLSAYILMFGARLNVETMRAAGRSPDGSRSGS
jgi:membrane protein